MKTIKIIISAFLLVTLSMSCTQKETLQSYFVKHQESPNFMSLDIPLSILDIDQAELNEEQKEAYESINKLNMLGYSLKEGNEKEFNNEIKQVKTILDDKKYEELMRAGNSTDGKIVVKYIGSDSKIDELIVFGTMNNKGFAIVRVLGDDMEPLKILKLGNVAQGINAEESQIKSFVEFFR